MDILDRMVQLSTPQLNFGNRLDGSEKGFGYFGPLKRDKGGFSTEISAGVEFDGKETEIPLLNPSLSREEILYLLSGNKATPEIIQKSVEFAISRMREGKNPFWGDSDTYRLKDAMP